MTIRRYSERALELLNRKPNDSAWGEGSRPIYDRLPAISEGYRKSLDYGRHGKVLEGCDPSYDRSSGKIRIKPGSISWYEGSTSFPEYIVDQPKDSGRWVISGQVVRKNKGISLYSKSYDWESVIGDPVEYIGNGHYRNPTQFAFMDNERVWLPSESKDSNQNYLGVVFPNGSLLSGVRAYGSGSSRMSLGQEGVSVENRNGYWEILFEDNGFRGEMRLIFDSGSAEVSRVLIKGEAYYPLNSVERGISEYDVGLGMYDLSSLADEEKRLCPLVSFEVHKGLVRDFRDIRSFTEEGNEPVAMWITESQDFDLQDLFKEVRDYRGKWLDTKTAAYHLYEKEVKGVNVQ